MNFRNLFLPLGLLLAVMLGVTVPGPGSLANSWTLAGWRLSHLAIVIIFILSGWNLAVREIRPGRELVGALLAALLVNLVGGPLIAALLLQFIPNGNGLALGLAVIACVPTTISSGIVITRMAGGNFAWALVMTMLLTLVGTLLLPFTLPLFLATTARLELDSLSLLATLSAIVIAPLSAGILLRRTGLRLPNPVTDYLPTSCVLVVVWTAVSQYAGAVRSMDLLQLLLYTTTAAAFHGLLLGLSWIAGRVLGLPWRDRLALLVVAAQKTLPLAVTALIAVERIHPNPGAVAVATVFCVLHQQIQIVFDAGLAQWLATRWSQMEDGSVEG
jgi:sodium/bile acid cotransporter 7